VRVRLSLIYTGLFLASGVVLLAVTYGLVASSLPVPKGNTNFNKTVEAQLNLECKQAASQPSLGKQQSTGPTPQACQQAYAAGATDAAVTQRNRTLHNLLVFSLVALGVVGLASAGLGWLMAGRALKPVRAITAAARKASEHQLGERVALSGPEDELKELADTFDQMLDRLDAAFASQRRFVSDASHELRTPLTVMQTAIDVTLAKPHRSAEQLEAMAAKVQRSIEQARSLIDALLTLATSRAEPISREPVDLATVAEDYLDTVSHAAAGRHLWVDADLEPAVTLGDRLLLERMVGNLVDNAIRHNHPEGCLRVRTESSGDAVRVQVVNTGPVIPADVVPSLFDPFRRMEERTSNLEGVGLGLAIVKSIASAHGGTVDANARRAGGLEVTVSLPGLANDR
jgi:signal transduction histidine kinase